MMKILICDDDEKFVAKLSNDIIDYFTKSNLKVVIDKKTNTFNIIETFDYDVIFMDIDLTIEKVDGITLAKRIKQKNPRALIVFTSAKNELVFNTFKVGGFQFIRKNHYKYDFNETIQQLNDYIRNNMCFSLINVNGRITKIYMNNIKYIMAIGHEINIFCYDGHIYYRATMKKTLEDLNFSNLVQIQKSIAVNLDYVDDFTKWKVICDKTEYKIGRVYQKHFLDLYENYLLTINGRI